MESVLRSLYWGRRHKWKGRLWCPMRPSQVVEIRLRVLLLWSSCSSCLWGVHEDSSWLAHQLSSLTLPLHRQWAQGSNELIRGLHASHWKTVSCNPSQVWALPLGLHLKKALIPPPPPIIIVKEDSYIPKSNIPPKFEVFPVNFKKRKKKTIKNRIPISYAKSQRHMVNNIIRRNTKWLWHFKVFSPPYSSVSQ